MRLAYLSAAYIFCNLISPYAAASDSTGAALSVFPAEIKLHGPRAAQQLLVTETVESRASDRTRTAAFGSTAPNIVRVDAFGLVKAVADGSAQIHIVLEGRALVVPVTISGLSRPAPVEFDRDVMPILTRFGCNSGSCHGKQRGQNGFQLSLL